MSNALKVAAGLGAEEKLYVDDVFSTYLYTGNGSTQTITNGIDLAGKGGLVWLKNRVSSSNNNFLFNTLSTPSKACSSNLTDAAYDLSSYFSFNNSGFAVNGNVDFNNASSVSWTFRKAPKFFSQATATVTGGADATVSFSDLTTLGMVLVKRTDSTGSWYVWHRSLTAGKLLYLEQTAAEATLGHITVSGTTVTLKGGVIANGTYIVYGFAHDTTTDGIIQCGSYVGGSVQQVTLGWEPQYLMIKNTGGSTQTQYDGWHIFDSMRGVATGGNDAYLEADSSSAENQFGVGNVVDFNATGFSPQGSSLVNVSGKTYIYLAIRRPNKPPTSGTSVYNGITANNAQGTINTTNFPIDLQFAKATGTVIGTYAADRLRGVSTTSTTGGSHLITSSTAAESSTNATQFWDNNGFQTSSGWAGTAMVYWNFRRAPGVFDVVCYTGNDTLGTAISHSLAAVPEMMIIKARTKTDAWMVYHKDLSGSPSFSLSLNSTANGNQGSAEFGNTTPTITSFYVGGATAQTNDSTITYVAYLFATKPGISKVGSYTGNGSSQTINCGFTAGARFVLIKRTDSTGDWFVWDSTRGIVASTDPHLSLNTTAAEVTTDDSIDPDNSGFIVNQLAATNINVTSATYIFLSFA